jgi:membrane-bound lytic murein transglycosylase D
VIGKIFYEEGVPRELLLVGLVESGYQSDAVSPAQAVGMWQFIPETARRFGLINDHGDFRTDVLRSTRAAAQYLRVLLDQFQDWRLALAAYNAGEDRVEEAIRRARSRDFSTISRLRLLPDETLNYVPAVLSAIAEARNHGLLAWGDRSLPNQEGREAAY